MRYLDGLLNLRIWRSRKLKKPMLERLAKEAAEKDQRDWAARVLAISIIFSVLVLMGVIYLGDVLLNGRG